MTSLEIFALVFIVYTIGFFSGVHTVEQVSRAEILHKLKIKK